MPASSEKQRRFMCAVCGGTAKNKPKSLSEASACEFCRAKVRSKRKKH